MLPTTCVINSAATLDESPLTRRNYWLRSMWLDCRIRGNDEVAFIPKDFIFEGGRRKKAALSKAIRSFTSSTIAVALRTSFTLMS